MKLYSLLIALPLLGGPLLAAMCENVTNLQLADTTITGAQVVAAGQFKPSGGTPSPAEAAVYRKLPAFCRVQGVIRPTSDSEIGFEVWMPISGWNQRYLAVGNGGFSGAINYTARADTNAPGLAEVLVGCYATSSTNTGHRSATTDADWSLGHPEKVIDYGYRAVHATAINAKAIIDSYYGSDPKKSYFSSCSNGGRQALMEAQRYPGDYDGIVAGDASWFATHGAAGFTWIAQALMRKPDSYIPARKVPAIEAAVIDKCDALDGVKDGVIDDPRKCHFDPAGLLCKGPESDGCLTRPQVDALQKIYAGPRNSKGEEISPGILPGGETGPRGWALWITGPEPGKSEGYLLGPAGFLAKTVYQDPSWDFRTFNFDRDMALLDDKLGPIRNAADANLKNFKERGGKLILYHGWSDPANAPLGTINYYQNVIGKMGQTSADEFLRVYMVPGMQHCGGGPGPDVLGAFPGTGADPQRGIQAALERWVENGTGPAEIIATKYKTAGKPEDGVARTRPICPYPLVARFKGSGSTDDAGNFSCVSER